MKLFISRPMPQAVIEMARAEFDVTLRGETTPLTQAEMVAALDTLKDRNFSLGCITNNVPSGKGAGMAMTDQKAEQVAEIMARFDHVIESSKAGIRKPDPRIYQMMCAALSVEPAQCVYLDDLGINCKPAAMLGMAAIKVTSGRQALKELGQILHIDFG